MNRYLRKFRNSEDGSFTIEAVLWIPVFVLILGFIVDLSMVYHKKSEMARIVQDANRAYAVGQLATDLEAEAFVALQIAALSTNATVATTVTNGIISTNLSVPTADLMTLDGFDFLVGQTINVSYNHFQEL